MKKILLLSAILSIALCLCVGCSNFPETPDDITAEGIDKEDIDTWFDVNKTDLPSLEECREITAGMSFDQVIRKIGKPQREIGHGAIIFQFDVDDGSVFTVSFEKDPEKIKNDPHISTYDCLVVFAGSFDTEIPDEYFPYHGTLSDLYSWIGGLHVEDITAVRYEQSFIGVAPGRLKDIAYSTNSVDIENTYRLLFRPLAQISDREGQIEGGGYVRYDFTTASHETYSVTVENNIVIIDHRYFKFVDNFYYAFQYSDVDCNSFITYDIPKYDEYEIYTYAAERVKVGNSDGLGEFEFCVYDGLIERTPRYNLRSCAVNLLILSPDQFMIEGGENTVAYRITGEKDFSALFAKGNDRVLPSSV